MSQLDSFILREIPVIQKIIRDETWLEGERRRAWVSPRDPVVRENVCRVILRIGGELRQALMVDISAAANPAMSPARESNHDRAA
jgi:hypothetical protein